VSIDGAHPFADAVTFVGLAARTPLRDWRDVLLPRYRAVELTPAYRTALLKLASAVDAMGYEVGCQLLVWRSREVADSITWFGRARSPERARCPGTC
jgi:hypothetical protein